MLVMLMNGYILTCRVYEFLERIVRFLASIGAIHEVDTNKFTAKHVTKNLSESLAEAGLSH